MFLFVFNTRNSFVFIFCQSIRATVISELLTTMVKCKLVWLGQISRTKFSNFLFVRPLVPLIWTSGEVCLGSQSQGTSLPCMLHHLHAMDSSNSPLVLHLLTSWQQAWQLSLFDLRTCAHTSIGTQNSTKDPVFGTFSILIIFIINYFRVTWSRQSALLWLLFQVSWGKTMWYEVRHLPFSEQGL